MICPKCDTINKDNAHICVGCGVRLSEKALRPGSKELEKKYLAIGAAVVVVIVMLLSLVLVSFCGACGGCNNAGESDINSNVEGDWNAETSLSDLSPSDISTTDTPAE